MAAAAGMNARSSADVKLRGRGTACGAACDAGVRAAASAVDACVRAVMARRWAVIALCAVLAVLPYLSDLDGGIVYDDKKAVVNPDVFGRNVSLAHLFRHDFWGNDMWANRRWTHNSYRPLTVLTWRLQFLLHGYELRYFHVVNVAIHAATAAVAAALLLQECGRRRRLVATVAAAVFAVHPIHTEVVTNLTGRCEPLCSIQVLLAVLLYSWSVPPPASRGRERSDERQLWLRVTTRGGRWACIAGAMVLGCTATLAKETGLVTPVLLLVYEVIRGGGGSDNGGAAGTGGNGNVSGARQAAGDTNEPSDGALAGVGGAAGTEACAADNDGNGGPGSATAACEGDGGSGHDHDATGGDAVAVPTFGSPRWYIAVARRPEVWALVAYALALAYTRVIWLTGGYDIKFSDFHNPLVSQKSRWKRLLSIAYIHAKATLLLVWPFRLSHEHVPFRVVPGLLDRRNLHTVALWCALAWLLRLAWRGAAAAHARVSGRRRGSVLTALALMLVVVPYLPASHILVKTAFVVPERQLFLPSLGYAMLAALAITWAAHALVFHPPQLCPPPATDDRDGGSSSSDGGSLKRCELGAVRRPVPRSELRRRAQLLAVVWSAVWVAVLFGRTWSRNLDWHSEDSLLRANLHVYPMNSMCQYALGHHVSTAAPDGHSRRGDAMLLRAALGSPTLGLAYESLADTALRRGDIDAAIMYTERGTRFGGSSHRFTNLYALTKGRMADYRREFYAIISLHSHALSSTEGDKLAIVSNNAACVTATSFHREFYDPVKALAILKEAFEVPGSKVGEVAAFNFAVIKVALGELQGARDVVKMSKDLLARGLSEPLPGWRQRLADVERVLAKGDTWLRAIVSRPAKRRVVEAGDLAAAGEQHERHGGTDGPPHVGETLHMLGLECVAVPLMNPVRKSVPKFAS